MAVFRQLSGKRQLFAYQLTFRCLCCSAPFMLQCTIHTGDAHNTDYTHPIL